MSIEVVAWSPAQFEQGTEVLRGALVYPAGKAAVTQEALAPSGEFTAAELLAIHRLNDPSA